MKIIEREQTSSTASFSKSSLLFSDQEDQDLSDLARNDSELVDSLIRARTTKDVEITLKKALTPKFVDKIDDSQMKLDETNEIVDLDADTGDIPYSRLSLNATAATLRRMAHITVLEARAELANSHRHTNVRLTATKSMPYNRSKMQKKMIANLLEAIGIKLMSHSSSLSPSGLNHVPDVRDHPGVYPLSDVLQALAVLAPNDAKKEKMRPFAILVVEFLNTHDSSELYKLGPIRLVQCLQAMAKLDIDHPSLYNKICQRLLKPDAVSKIPARFLAHGLSAIAKFQETKTKKAENSSEEWELSGQEETRDKNSENQINNHTMRLSRAFMRRLRKRKVAKEASIEDMCRALVATRNLLDLGAMATMEDEAAMFGFTGLRTILEIRKSVFILA